jgi:aryl-alcohol dehydrogenase-like predicted oxidoreductase
MRNRALGKTGLVVSEIGLGCMGMDHAYGPAADRKAMVELIHEAVDRGCTFFDTAEVYGAANEELVGMALASLKGKVVIATKYGIVTKTEDVGDRNKPMEMDSSPDAVRTALEGSLRRLQVECIDFYYQHRVDPKVAPEDVAATMNALIKEGKVRSWGLSEAPAEYIERANAVCPATALESQYSMVWRKPEAEIVPTCERLGVGYVAYSPLGNGFLSGKYGKETKYQEGDFRNFMGRFKPEVMDANQNLLNVIRGVADSKSATPAQIALAWVLAQKPWIVPIPGTTKRDRLRENLGASEKQLSDAELRDLDAALAKITVNETHF